MSPEFFLARRLSLSTRKSGDNAGKRSTAPGVKIAVVGIALSYIIMLLSIAIVTGFKSEIRSKVTGFEQQISIERSVIREGIQVNEGIRLNDTIIDIIKSVAPEAEISLSIFQPAILKTDENFEGVVIKGISSGSGSNFLSSNIIAGNYPDFECDEDENPLFISSTTAKSLGLDVDSTVISHFFINDNLHSRKLTVKAIYDTHFGDYDKTYAFTTPEFLQKLNRIDSVTGSALEINGLETESIDLTTEKLRSKFFEAAIDSDAGESFYIHNVNMSGAIYFNWLALLDTNVLVILLLMGCVSGFTLVSSLFIIVLQRIPTIGILKALGATDFQIRKVFILLSARILALGLLAGNIIGLGVYWLQAVTGFIPLDAEAYYLSYVPVKTDVTTVVVLNLVIVMVSLILLLVPSQIVSRLSPSETMRYE